MKRRGWKRLAAALLFVVMLITAVPYAAVAENEAEAEDTIYFVDLFWEEGKIDTVYAIFDGGSQEAQKLAMQGEERGRYSVQIPQGDYTEVQFGVVDQSGEEQLTEYGYCFRGSAQDREDVKDVSFQKGKMDTFYYDGQGGESYWGADALYEPGENSIAAYAADPSEDKAGELLYFVDMPKDDMPSVKRVKMQLFSAGHAEDAQPDKEIVMYEGRDGIYSAPIPEGGYEEVSFYLEYDGIYTGDGEGKDWYQIVRHFNIYGQDVDGQHESLTYTVGSLDTFFYNHMGEPSYNSIVDSYWGGHPSVTDRSLSAQIIYVNTQDLNENGIYLDPATLTISYKGEEHRITKQTREAGIYYYQFPQESSATEQTILTLKGRIAGGDSAGEEITFGFYYPYNSGKKMIVTDHLREMLPVFEEFVMEEEPGSTFYICYDNTSTQFTNIQYRTRTSEDRAWTTWDNLTKTNPDDWADLATDASIVENIWGAEYQYNGDGEVYVQFRGTENNATWVSQFTNDTGTQRINGQRRDNPYLWRTSSDTSLADVRFPADEYSYPCFYGEKDGEENGINATTANMSGSWRSALDVDNRGDGTVKIPEGTYQQENDTYYGTSAFYDYYSDSQIAGKTLAQDGSNRTNKINHAVEEYYREAGVQTPVYMNSDYTDNNTNLYGYMPAANRWSGYTTVSGSITKRGIPYTGLVDDQLNEDGRLTADGAELPLFNEAFLRGGNSTGAAVGNVYHNVKFPFSKNTDKSSSSYGYWEFDSSKEEQALILKEDVNRGYYLERTGKGILDNQNKFGFFPFDSANGSENYMFGTHFEIPFTLPEGNVVQIEEGGEEKPVTFEFSGDDDAWVFVDGELLLDIGGIHDAVQGTINFQTGVATVQYYNYNESTGQQVGKREVTKTFTLDPTKKEHTLSMYYMERGLGSSNLKVTFNFPKTNTLNVTNSIDTSAANPIFSDAMSYIGSFPYRISNKVVAGDRLAVEDSAGFISSAEPLVFHDLDRESGIGSAEAGDVKAEIGSGGGRDGVLSITQENRLTSASTEAEILKRLVPVSPQRGSTVDISSYAYLRLEAFNDRETEDSNGRILYVALRDQDGNRIGGWGNDLTYDGSSNSAGSKEWSLMRLDIDKMHFLGGADSFDRTKVAAVEIAYRYADGDSVYVDNLEFYQAITEVPSHGFSVEQDQISDYGSVKADGSYALSEVDKAWYGHYASGVSEAKYRMVENGFFSVGDNQRAEFLDKFRVGTYLQITQEDIDPYVFDTSWSILEGENQDEIAENFLLPSRTDMTTIVNTGELLSLTGQAGTTANDGRISKNKNLTDESRPEGGAFVYRSYASPDDNEINPIYLTVAYKNVLKTGSITIHKTLSLEEQAANPEGAVYEFEVVFTNVAGMDLETEPITAVMQVEIGADGTGTAVLDGIPAGTEYEIRERKGSGLVLKSIEGAEYDTTDGTHHICNIVDEADGNSGEPYVEGTVYGGQELTFLNTVEPFQMQIEKRWEDAGNEENRPDKIGIQLFRKDAGASDDTYENVTKTFYEGAVGEDGNPYIELSEQNADTGNDAVWRATTKELDTINTETGKLYVYKIEEIPLDGAEGWNLKNYTPEYIQGDVDGTFVVINRPATMKVEKVWADNGDKSRPTSIEVQLQRKGADEDDSGYRDFGDPIKISVNSSPSWQYIGDVVERVDAAGKEYVYRAIEKKLIASDGTEYIVNQQEGSSTNGYTVSYDGNEENTELTITNSKGTGEVVLIKSDKKNEDLRLKGAQFKLERLKPREDDQTEEDLKDQFQQGGYNNTDWTVDPNYGSAVYTTDEDGEVNFGFLPFGYYRLTEVKAPTGYYTLSEPYDFSITEEVLEEVEAETGNSYLTLTILDTKKLSLPISGAAGTLMFTLAGLVLTGGAMLLYKVQKRKTQSTIRKRRGRRV